MSRRLRYHVAVSLDGFIAGPNGEYDWIVMDPSIDFTPLCKEFDTAVMERRTYQLRPAQDGHGGATKLVLADQKTLPASGIVALSYSVPGGVGAAPRIRYVKSPRTRGNKSKNTGKSPKRTVARKRVTK